MSLTPHQRVHTRRRTTHCENDVYMSLCSPTATSFGSRIRRLDLVMYMNTNFLRRTQSRLIPARQVGVGAYCCQSTTRCIARAHSNLKRNEGVMRSEGSLVPVGMMKVSTPVTITHHCPLPRRNRSAERGGTNRGAIRDRQGVRRVLAQLSGGFVAAGLWASGAGRLDLPCNGHFGQGTGEGLAGRWKRRREAA